MNTKDSASILRLQCEHIQELVRSLTAKLATLEQAVVVDDRFDVLPPLQLAEVGRMSQYVQIEAERLHNYIEEITLNQGGSQPQPSI